MENNQTDFDRLLAGQVASDDPTWGRVAAFLDQVQASPTLPDVQQLAEPHLRLMRQATVLETTKSHHPHQSRLARRSRRIIIGAVAGVLAGITAGVGVAAASGSGGPAWIGWLPWSAPSTSPASSMTPTGSPSDRKSLPAAPVATTAPSATDPTTSAPLSPPTTNPSKADKRVADPSKGIIPSATSRGKSSAAPGHTKTLAPPSADPTAKTKDKVPPQEKDKVPAKAKDKVPTKAPKD